MGTLLWQDPNMIDKYLFLYWSISISLSSPVIQHPSFSPLFGTYTLPFLCSPVTHSVPSSCLPVTFSLPFPVPQLHSSPHMTFHFSSLLLLCHPHNASCPLILLLSVSLSLPLILTFTCLCIDLTWLYTFLLFASVFSMHDLSLPHFHTSLIPRFYLLTFHPPATMCHTEPLTTLPLNLPSANLDLWPLAHLPLWQLHWISHLAAPKSPCQLNCMMYSYLYDTWSTVLCLPTFMMSFYLYYVC
jgi:hypothetical protein